MTGDDSYGASAERLTRLVRLTPDADRTARVRARCRAQLEGRRRRTERAAETTAVMWRLFGPLVVGGVCVLYVIALVTTTLDLRDVLY